MNIYHWILNYIVKQSVDSFCLHVSISVCAEASVNHDLSKYWFGEQKICISFLKTFSTLFNTVLSSYQLSIDSS